MTFRSRDLKRSDAVTTRGAQAARVSRKSDFYDTIAQDADSSISHSPRRRP